MVNASSPGEPRGPREVGAPETQDAARVEQTPFVSDASRAADRNLLLVDDDPDILKLLAHHLTRRGHECASASTAEEALEKLGDGVFDGVLMDLHMPGMGGLGLLEAIRRRNEEIALVVVTGSRESHDAIAALKLGADEYVEKPFSAESLLLSVGRALEKRDMKVYVRKNQLYLEGVVLARTRQLERLFESVILSLVHTLEAKDVYTDGHSRRVAWLTLQLACAAGVSSGEQHSIHLGAMFHDLGKIGIAESILLKPTKLTPDEYAEIQKHPEIGVRILSPLEEFRASLPTILHHHERWDGAGYPSGLAGESIPIGARIVGVVDAFDAMTTTRPYRWELRVEDALARLRDASGTQFDTGLVELFIPIARSSGVQEFLFASGWRSTRVSPGTLDLTNR